MVISTQQNHGNILFKDILRLKKIQRLTDIQKKALPFINSMDNLVIVAPSGAGKTLIAEMIALKDIIHENLFNKIIEDNDNNQTISYKVINDNYECYTKTIFLVPLRALAEEKASDLARSYKEYKLKIHLSMSDVDFNEEEIINCHILISTYERFRTIIGRLPNILDYIQNVVIDEFHIISSEERGPVLETILTSLLDKVRLILLSATAANPNDIAQWLKAKLIFSDKRLIPLEFNLKQSLLPKKEVMSIIEENIKDNSQVLIFCGTRKKTEENAQYYADFIYKICKENNAIDEGEIFSFLETLSLNKETIGNQFLFNLAGKGTGIHHAGLSRLAKKAVEELFKRNAIKVLFCTETLGAGVNLPAKEVIILDTKRANNEWLTRNTFHQIAGRAGRPNYDIYGKCTVLVGDGREKKSIIMRYWDQNQEKVGYNLEITKPKFDIISSRINSIDEFEKMILTLIYTNKPTLDELILLLQKSFFQFRSNKCQKSEKKHLLKTLLLTINESEYESLKIFEKIYPFETLVLEKIFENDINQTFQITDKFGKFFVTKNNEQFQCSCNDKLFCNHKSFILNLLPESISVAILNRHFSILEKLILDGFVVEKTSGVLETTSKGIIWAEMGVTKPKFEYIKDWMLNGLLLKKINLTSILLECIKIVPLIESNGNPLNGLEYQKPIYEHIILKREFLDVVTKYQLFEGDILRMEVSLKSLIASLLPLTEYLGLEKIKLMLENLDLLLFEALCEI
ncbi:MAG: DEAD/DEAH box helicase [Candidatus Heimdallarchaeota archaeon]|nr:DEAD/DEAH box helicase [Candidatus Heimdallarchaeota archaeon]